MSVPAGLDLKKLGGERKKGKGKKYSGSG